MTTFAAGFPRSLGQADRGRLGGVVRRSGGSAWWFLRWYEWLLLLAVLDVMLTWVVMQLGAIEANRVAAAVVRMFGPPGLVLTKAVAVVSFVAMCELVRRRRPGVARVLLFFAIGVGVVPVVVGTLVFIEASAYARLPEYWTNLWFGPTTLR